MCLLSVHVLIYLIVEEYYCSVLKARPKFCTIPGAATIDNRQMGRTHLINSKTFRHIFTVARFPMLLVQKLI